MSRNAQFTQKYPNQSFDQALWKQFWHKHQSYHTLCLPCIADKKERDRKYNEMKGKMVFQTKKTSLDWNAVMLGSASEAIITNWYRAAHVKIFGSGGKRRRQHIDISDDDADDFSQRQWTQHPNDLTHSTSRIAMLWLRSARAKLQRDGAINRRNSE